jgi:GNAT superfamily N-acetyltransferase
MREEVRIVEGVEHVDFDTVHAWLAGSYWSPGITRDRVERAARGSSLVLSVFAGSQQAGYMRVVSDRATFAWICDVFVGEDFRGRGIGKAMVRHALQHPEHQGLRRWVLATKDAHDVYRECGFEELWEPHRWMIYFPGGTPITIG